MRENRENGEAHHTVTGALKNSFSIGIGSGDVLVGVRTEKEFFNAPGLAHGAVETGRFSAFLTLISTARQAFRCLQRI